MKKSKKIQKINLSNKKALTAFFIILIILFILLIVRIVVLQFVEGNDLKKIVPTKEIKPVTFQIKNKQVIELDKYASVECLDKTNITIFASNKLDIKRNYKSFSGDDYKCYELEVDNGEDIVIVGLGFIKVSKKAKFKVYTLENVLVYKRDSLI